jgi:hypothetical protein
MKLLKFATYSLMIILTLGKQALPGVNLMPDSVTYGYATNDNYVLQNAAVFYFLLRILKTLKLFRKFRFI